MSTSSLIDIIESVITPENVRLGHTWLKRKVREVIVQHTAAQGDAVERVRMAMYQVECPHKHALSIRDIEMLAEAAIAAMEGVPSQGLQQSSSAEPAKIKDSNLAPSAQTNEISDIIRDHVEYIEVWTRQDRLPIQCDDADEFNKRAKAILAALDTQPKPVSGAEDGLREDLEQLIRVCLTNPKDIVGFIAANYPKHYAKELDDNKGKTLASEQPVGCREAFEAYCKDVFDIDVVRHPQDGYGAFEDQWRGWNAAWYSKRESVGDTDWKAKHDKLKEFVRGKWKGDCSECASLANEVFTKVNEIEDGEGA